MIPCIDCITLPICRSRYLNYPDNTVGRTLKVRFTISKCSPACKAVYSKESKIRHVNTYDSEIIEQIAYYYEHLKPKDIRNGNIQPL